LFMIILEKIAEDEIVISDVLDNGETRERIHRLISRQQHGIKKDYLKFSKGDRDRITFDKLFYEMVAEANVLFSQYKPGQESIAALRKEIAELSENLDFCKKGLEDDDGLNLDKMKVSKIDLVRKNQKIIDDRTESLKKLKKKIDEDKKKLSEVTSKKTTVYYDESIDHSRGWYTVFNFGLGIGWWTDKEFVYPKDENGNPVPFQKVEKTILGKNDNYAILEENAAEGVYRAHYTTKAMCSGKARVWGTIKLSDRPDNKLSAAQIIERLKKNIEDYEKEIKDVTELRDKNFTIIELLQKGVSFATYKATLNKQVLSNTLSLSEKRDALQKLNQEIDELEVKLAQRIQLYKKIIVLIDSLVYDVSDSVLLKDFKSGLQWTQSRLSQSSHHDDQKSDNGKNVNELSSAVGKLAVSQAPVVGKKSRESIEDSSYLYTDTDINQLLKKYLIDDKDAFIAAAHAPLAVNEDAARAFFKVALIDALQKNIPTVIPLNTAQSATGNVGEDAHWVGLIIKPNIHDRTRPTVIYMDPQGHTVKKTQALGRSIFYKEASKLDIAKLGFIYPMLAAVCTNYLSSGVNPALEISTLKQQYDSTSCGPFTVDNLVAKIHGRDIQVQNPLSLRKKHHDMLSGAQARRAKIN
jgi:hypothetical protein